MFISSTYLTRILVVVPCLAEGYSKFQSKNPFEKIALSNFNNKIIKVVHAIRHQGDIKCGMPRGTQWSCM